MFTTRQPYVAETAQKLGAEILIDASDELTPVSSAGMNKVCKKKHCVFYRKHCDSGKLSCSFIYATAERDAGEIDLGESLVIRTNMKATLFRAVENIWVQIGETKADKNYVKLTRLDIESAQTSPLECSNRAWIQGCRKPRFFGLTRP